jgi:transposase
MAFRELRMTDIREVLRRWQTGASTRSIALDGVADRKTIARYVRAAEECGVSASSQLDDETIARIAKVVSGHLEGRPLSDHWAALAGVREQMQAWLLGKEPLQLTRVHELLAREGILVPYTTLRRYAHRELGWRKPKTTVRLSDPEPGQEAQVDFGEMGRITTAVGLQRLWVLVVTLSWSRYMFVYPSLDQTLTTVCDGLDAAWRFFGGVVARIVPDNPTTIVVRADRTDPRIHPSFAEYADSRGFLVDPARVRHPQDKGKVESNVRFVRERWFKGELFEPGIESIRKHAEVWCREVAGARIHGTTRRVPWEEFHGVEQARLRPAPSAPFDVPDWLDAKVHPDHHIQVKKALYSVPHLYAERRAKVRVRVDRKTVRIYFRNDLIKTHPRVETGQRSTDASDYPIGKAAFATRSLDALVARGCEQGEAVGEFIERLLEGPLPWTRMRQAYALIRLCEKYGAPRVNEVCRRSLDFDVLETGRVERMLRTAQKLETAEQKDNKLVRLSSASRFARPQESFRTVAVGGKEGDEQ